MAQTEQPFRVLFLETAGKNKRTKKKSQTERNEIYEEIRVQIFAKTVHFQEKVILF